ncbi:MAG: T9SS type A sorting domain-containing protein [Cytophagaceae bacterium]
MLCGNGFVYTFGSNNNSKLGTNNAQVESYAPVQVLRGAQAGPDPTYLSQIKQVDAGSGGHNIALDCSGGVYTWGWNAAGQLGDNTNTDRAIPVKVLKGNQTGNATAFLNNVVYITGGNDNSYVILGTGEVMSWGQNTSGQLGDGTTTNRLTPVYVQTSAGVNLTNVVQIDGGDDFAVALKSDGTVWTWGFDGNKALGLNGAGNQSFAKQVLSPSGTGFLTNITKITAGDTHVMAVDKNGMLWAWGGNWSGQLGIGGGADQGLPKQVFGVGGIGVMDSVVAIAGGNNHSLAVRKNGNVVAFGATNAGKDFGQLGIGGGSSAFPVYVRDSSNIAGSRLKNVVDVSEGDSWSFAVTTNGTVFDWGQNEQGASPLQGFLGLGATMTAATYTYPKKITLPCPAVKPCPKAFLGQNVTLCNPMSASLYAGSSDPLYQFVWKENGTVIPGATTDSYTALAAGTYKVIISAPTIANGCGTCPTDSASIVISSTNPTTAVDPAYCTLPATLNFGVSGPSGANYDWYSSPSGGVKLNGAPSASYSAVVNSVPAIYYAQDRNSVSYKIGKTLGDPTLGGSAGAWHQNDNVNMKFDAATSFVFDSVTVKITAIPGGPCCCGNATWPMTISLFNSGGTLIGSSVSNAPCVANSVYKAYLGITVPVSTGNYITMSGGQDLLAAASYTGSYPLSAAGVMSITGAKDGIASHYGGYYDWVIHTGGSCGRIPVQAFQNCTAPVRLLTFTAMPSDGQVVLLWSTASEENNDYFAIERSADGVNFQSIGMVNGSGTSSSVKDYIYTDANPVRGISYYRLRQVDFDGGSSYSHVMSVNNSSSSEISVNLYPNPFSNETNLYVSSGDKQKLSIKIYDVTGKTVFASDDYFTNEKITLGNDLPEGLYVLKVFHGQSSHTYKIAKTQ